MNSYSLIRTSKKRLNSSSCQSKLKLKNLSRQKNLIAEGFRSLTIDMDRMYLLLLLLAVNIGGE